MQQNFNFAESDEEEDNGEFSMINLNFLYLDLEVSDLVTMQKVLWNMWKVLWNMFLIDWRSAASLQFYNAKCIALQVSRKKIMSCNPNHFKYLQFYNAICIALQVSKKNIISCDPNHFKYF